MVNEVEDRKDLIVRRYSSQTPRKGGNPILVVASH